MRHPMVTPSEYRRPHMRVVNNWSPFLRQNRRRRIFVALFPVPLSSSVLHRRPHCVITKARSGNCCSPFDERALMERPLKWSWNAAPSSLSVVVAAGLSAGGWSPVSGPGHVSCLHRRQGSKSGGARAQLLLPLPSICHVLRLLDLCQPPETRAEPSKFAAVVLEVYGWKRASFGRQASPHRRSAPPLHQHNGANDVDATRYANTRNGEQCNHREAKSIISAATAPSLRSPKEASVEALLRMLITVSSQRESRGSRNATSSGRFNILHVKARRGQHLRVVVSQPKKPGDPDIMCECTYVQVDVNSRKKKKRNKSLNGGKI